MDFWTNKKAEKKCGRARTTKRASELAPTFLRMVYDHRARAHLRAQFWRASYAWLQQCGDGGSLTQNKGPVKTMRLFCDLVRERERGRERERERECCYTSSGGGLVLGRALHEKSRGECSARPGSRNCNRLLFDARENFLSLSLSLCFSLFHFCPDLDKKESLEKRIFYLPKIGPGPPFLEKRLLAFPLSLPLSLYFLEKVRLTRRNPLSNDDCAHVW